MLRRPIIELGLSVRRTVAMITGFAGRAPESLMLSRSEAAFVVAEGLDRVAADLDDVRLEACAVGAA